MLRASECGDYFFARAERHKARRVPRLYRTSPILVKDLHRCTAGTSSGPASIQLDA